MLQWIKRALSIGQAPLRAEECYRLGAAESLRGNNSAAEALFRRAVAADGMRAEYHYALGCALHASGESEAIECYQRTLALDPAFVPAMINLGSILQHAGARRAGAQAQLDEALALFRRATEAAPQAPEGWINLGFALERRRQLPEARDAYDRALAIDPRLADARFNRSLVLLALGDFEQGWREYEARWPATGFARPDFGGPEWEGQPLEGKTIFLYTEQGFGDAIQFIRYCALLASRGARTVVRCQPQLRRLFQGVRGVTDIVPPDEVPPFDFHCSLLSLGHVFGTTAETIPAAVPYIGADPALAAAWRTRLAQDNEALRVGVAWSSQSLMPDAAGKSTTLEALAPLGDLQRVRYYSLQVGKGNGDATRSPVPMVDLTGAIADFADTAALIDNLDLVLSVDTAVAHLAGAMGKPVWTLLRYAPDWRWYPVSSHSRWYPTMRLYRQPSPGDWRGVVEPLARDLAALRATSST
jgi:hypothetical protein